MKIGLVKSCCVKAGLVKVGLVKVGLATLEALSSFADDGRCTEVREAGEGNTQKTTGCDSI